MKQFQGRTNPKVFKSAEECAVDEIIVKTFENRDKNLSIEIFLLTHLLRIKLQEGFISNIIRVKNELDFNQIQDFLNDSRYFQELEEISESFKDLEHLSKVLNAEIYLYDTVTQEQFNYFFFKFRFRISVYIEKSSEKKFLSLKKNFKSLKTTEDSLIFRHKKFYNERFSPFFQNFFETSKKEDLKDLKNEHDDESDTSKKSSFVGVLNGSSLTLFSIKKPDGSFIRPTFHSFNSIKEKLEDPNYKKIEFKTIEIPVEFHLPTQQISSTKHGNSYSKIIN